MTPFLKEYSLTEQDLRRFKSVLESFGASLEADEIRENNGICLIPKPGALLVRVINSDDKTDAVKDAILHFGFEIVNEPPHDPGSARVDMTF